VLYTDVSQSAKSGGLKMLETRAMAGMLPMLGGGGMGNMGAQMAASAVTQTVVQSQMADAQEDAMANAMAAINGAQKSNVKAGDSLTLQYKLVRAGEDQPFKEATIVGKAKAAGDDVLSPMIESVAVAVVGSVVGNWPPAHHQDWVRAKDAQKPTTVHSPAPFERSCAKGMSELESMARMPPAAKAAMRAPSTLLLTLAPANPATLAIPQASTTQLQIPVTRRQFHPADARSAEGAMACGIFDTNTAAMKATLTGAPLAS
jgi:hypothetical protein